MKKTDVKALAKNIPNIPVHDVTLTDACFDGLTIQVKERLDMQGAAAFAESVVSSVIDMEAGNYTPEFRDFVIRMMTLRFYADIPVEEYKTDIAYSLVYNTSIYDDIVGCIDVNYYNDLFYGIKEKISYMRTIQESAPAMKLNQLMDTMERMIADSTETVDMINSNEFKDIVGRLSEATKQMTEVKNVEEAKPETEEPAASGQLVAFPAQTVDEAVTEVVAAVKPAAKKRSRKRAEAPKTE